MSWRSGWLPLLIAALGAGTAPGGVAAVEVQEGANADAAVLKSAGFALSAAERVAQSLEEPALREIVFEILERNPALAAAEARARAAAEGVPRTRTLPNPQARLTGFLASPETRTGPQEVAVGVSQAIPWLGKLALAERGALEEAAALEAEVEALRLEKITAARRVFHELQYLDSRRLIGIELRDHLEQHEEIARARYSTGAGRGQGVIKLQAEITLAENELLDIRRHRIQLESRLNALRDRPPLTPILAEAPVEASEPPTLSAELESLVAQALRARPEIRAAEARNRRAELALELAGTSRRPNFSLGLTYTVVDPRDDALGRLQPPEGNGDDVVALWGGISLPVWKKSRVAEVEEALARESAAREAARSERLAVEAAIADLVQRLELDRRRMRLIADLLVVQAEEAEESALAGYIAGNLNALELLDAEHVRFDAHTALARTRADYLIGIAELEGALGAPLDSRLEGIER